MGRVGGGGGGGLALPWFVGLVGIWYPLYAMGWRIKATVFEASDWGSV